MLKKAFTLIELLVVIAIMAVIASAVLVAINPLDKINSANDSKVQADIGQISTALNTYAVSHNGAYPCKATAAGCPNAVAGDGAGLTALVNSGEMTGLPVPPTGYVGFATYEAGYYANAVAATPTQFKLVGEVKSNKNLGVTGTSARWLFCSWTGSSAFAALTASVNANATACP